MTESRLVKLAGEPSEIERLTLGSEGGGWKSGLIETQLAGRLPYGAAGGAITALLPSDY
jgi:hypothetical protein